TARRAMISRSLRIFRRPLAKAIASLEAAPEVKGITGQMCGFRAMRASDWSAVRSRGAGRGARPTWRNLGLLDLDLQSRDLQVCAHLAWAGIFAVEVLAVEPSQ